VARGIKDDGRHVSGALDPEFSTLAPIESTGLHLLRQRSNAAHCAARTFDVMS